MIRLAFLHHWQVVSEGTQTRLELDVVQLSALVLVEMPGGWREKMQALKNGAMFTFMLRDGIPFGLHGCTSCSVMDQ